VSAHVGDPAGAGEALQQRAVLSQQAGIPADEQLQAPLPRGLDSAADRGFQASSSKHSDLVSSCQRAWRPGSSFMAAAGVLAVSCEQDVFGWAPDAGHGLGDRTEPEY
jgi:hypothetical protein